MTTTPENFTTQDDRARIAKTRAAMSAKGLDAKFVTDPSNRSWLTGYDGWSFYVHQGVVLAMQGDPLWWGAKWMPTAPSARCSAAATTSLASATRPIVANARFPFAQTAGLAEYLVGLGNPVTKGQSVARIWPADRTGGAPKPAARTAMAS